MTELKTKTVSQCITADYCRGWTDAVEEANKVLDRIVEQLEYVLNNSIPRVNGKECNKREKTAYEMALEYAIKIVKDGGKNE